MEKGDWGSHPFNLPYGGGGNRTRVRRSEHRNIYERVISFDFSSGCPRCRVRQSQSLVLDSVFSPGADY